jgi:hypothetical protein
MKNGPKTTLGGENRGSGGSSAGPPPGAPSHPPATPPPRRVAFTQGGLRGGGGQVSVTAAIIPMFMMWGSGAAVAAFFGLGRFPWLPPGVRAAIVTAIFVAALYFLFRLAVRGYRRVNNSIRLPMEMDPGADVNVICWPDQKAELERDLPEEGTVGAFEPEVFRVWITRRTPMAVRILTRKGRTREVFRVLALVIVLQLFFVGIAQNWVAREPMIAVVALAAVSPFLWSFVSPAYLRVVPGRVDVIRFRPGLFGLGGTIAGVERIGLRDRPVRLDMKRRELLVGGWHRSHAEHVPEQGSPSDPGEESRIAGTAEAEALSHRQSVLMSNASMKDPQASLGSAAQIRAVRIVPLWGSLDIGGACRAVFRAAVSTAEPGPVPDDALL